jgi:hypothetical protein
MRLFFTLGVVWTFVVVLASQVWPWSVPTGDCWRPVHQSADCLAEAARLNEQVWRTQAPPLLAFVASGYIVVGLVGVRALPGLVARRLRLRRH